MTPSQKVAKARQRKRDALMHLIRTGTRLSNSAFNLSQRPGTTLTLQNCDTLKENQLEWDRAVCEVYEVFKLTNLEG